jgi:hypothetical protein
MNIQNCPLCRRALAVGVVCMCVTAVHHVPKVDAELSPIVFAAPHPSHSTESEIERQLVMRPVAAITTSNTMIRPLTSAMQFNYEQPPPFVRGPLNTLVTIITSYPPKA